MGLPPVALSSRHEASNGPPATNAIVMTPAWSIQ